MAFKRRSTAYEFLLLSPTGDLDVWIATLVRDCEGEVFDIGLNFDIAELASDETLRVEDGVVGVHDDLVLGGMMHHRSNAGRWISGHVRVIRLPWSLAIIYTIILPDTDASECKKGRSGSGAGARGKDRNKTHE